MATIRWSLLAVLALAGCVWAQTYPDIATALKAEKANVMQLLIKSAGLDAKLGADTAVTLFIPTDKAMFSTAKTTPLGNTAVLARKDLLKLILSYHTIPSTNVGAGTYKTSLPNVPAISVSKAGPGGVVTAKSSSATIVKGPIKAGKSTIYFIDNMLLPSPANQPLRG